MSQTMRPSKQRSAETEMMAKSLQQENDILRFQLNDLISREKNQRLELQRLRAHRDVEVTALVNVSTQKLKGEIERVKALLEPASSSLTNAIAEKEKVVAENEQLMDEIKKLRKIIDEEESTYGGRLRSLESIMIKGTAMASNILKSVEACQRHVLPNFKLKKLEDGVALLRVIVDAKNDTLVLIRGKLKQENDELRQELAAAREQKPLIQQAATVTEQAASCADEVGAERNILRQEITALQDLYTAKFKQLQTNLKAHEEAGIVHQTRYGEIQQECRSLQAQLSAVDASRHQLEDNLKDETSARSQLVSEIYNMRKENEALRAELEMVKMNQKFFGGHARKGRLRMEEMDLINTVNQLLLENSKLRSDKVALEEEVKNQRRSNVLHRVKSVVSARDVALCANDKVGDSELANKLARVRLHHLGGPGTPQFALTNGSPGYQSLAVENPFMQATACVPGLANWSSPCEDPTTTAAESMKMSDLYETGQTALAQLAGLTDRRIIDG